MGIIGLLWGSRREKDNEKIGKRRIFSVIEILVL